MCAWMGWAPDRSHRGWLCGPITASEVAPKHHRNQHPSQSTDLFPQVCTTLILPPTFTLKRIKCACTWCHTPFIHCMVPHPPIYCMVPHPPIDSHPHIILNDLHISNPLPLLPHPSLLPSPSHRKILIWKHGCNQLSCVPFPYSPSCVLSLLP